MGGKGWVGGGDDFHHQFLNSRKEVPSQIFRYKFTHTLYPPNFNIDSQFPFSIVKTYTLKGTNKRVIMRNEGERKGAKGQKNKTKLGYI